MKPRFSTLHGEFPGRVTLELTNMCNLVCTFCPRRYMEKERGFMDTALAIDLIDEMSEHAPVALVPFFRGETLLHPDWFKILSHFQSKTVGEIQFTTNATLLSAEDAERILDLELPIVSFSLDTLDPALYNISRRGGDFESTMQNVLHFLKRKKERGAEVEVQVSAVETPEHRAGMDAFVEYWKARVDRVRVYAEHSSDGNLGGIDSELPEFDDRWPCRKAFTDMVVYWNGQVACCNHDWIRQVDGPSLGDVSKAGIAAVWHGEAYRELREAHKCGRVEHLKPCSGCDHWKMYYMKAGLLGRTYSRNR